MAQATPISRHLQIQLQVGTMADGSPKVSSKNYANVLPSAADDDVLAVGQALAALFAEPLVQIARVDTTGLAASAAGTAGAAT